MTSDPITCFLLARQALPKNFPTRLYIAFIPLPHQKRLQQAYRHADGTSIKTFKYENGSVERTYTFDENRKMTDFTVKRGDETRSYTVDPESGIATNNQTHEQEGRIHVDSVTGNVTIHETGREEYMEKPDLSQKLQAKTGPESFMGAAKQQSGQGYWQVADQMLQATHGDENSEDTRAQNIVLMRALQRQHQQQGGALGRHNFLASQSDLARLNENIDAYIQEHPQFEKYKEALHRKFSAVSAF